MSDTSTVESHLSAAESRWGDEAVTDLTDEAITKPNGGTVDAGVPKFEVRPASHGAKNGAIATQTAKQILMDAGYDVFYRTRTNGNGNRDPKAVVAVFAPGAAPVNP